MSHAIESKRARRVLAVLLGALSMVTQGVRAEDLMIPLELPQLNFFGGGVGSYPDYFGSKDYDVGAAPFGRFSLGGSRFVRLLGNEIRVNVLDDRNWQLGPAALWRFSRKDVENPVVNKVHEIDDALSLGLFGGYVWRDTQEIRRMAGVGAWAFGDTTDVYNGWTAGLNAYAMQPVARMVTLAGGAAFTYGSENYMNEYLGVTPADSLASGLPVYQPGGGVRDVRGWVTAVVSLSLHWHLGVGAMYSRLVGNAADSPLVAQEGSKNQWIYGAGALYAW
jgi:outer membrane protein